MDASPVHFRCTMTGAPSYLLTQEISLEDSTRNKDGTELHGFLGKKKLKKKKKGEIKGISTQVKEKNLPEP